jgi:flagellar biosynthesis protein FliR
MTVTAPDDLRNQLPALAHGLMLVLARVGSVATLLPGIGDAETPMTVRAGWAFALTLVLFPVVAPLLPAMPAGPAPLAAEVAAEIVTGLWLGWLARLAVMAMPMAGGVISYMTGLSSVLHPSTDGGGQNPALSQLFTLSVPVIVLASGLYALPLRALVGSYTLIAPGHVLPAGDGTQMIVAALSAAFTLTLQLAAPFVIASVVWQATFGFVAWLVPRLHVHFAGLPGQLLGGLALLAMLGGSLLLVWSDAIRDGWSRLPGL